MEPGLAGGLSAAGLAILDGEFQGPAVARESPEEEAMRKTGLTKTDVFIALACIAFLLANLGAVGSGSRRRAKEGVCASNVNR
jgi:hypothetical protein